MTAVYMPGSDTRTVVRWATNSSYPTRAHMTNGRGRVSLCGFPVDPASQQRPDGLGICPDCATTFIDLTFPLDTHTDSDQATPQWFRQLPSPDPRP